MKVLLSVAEVVAAVLVIRYRSARGEWDFGLRRPHVGALLGWVAIYAAWMLGTNAIWDWRGPWDFAPWRAAPLAVDAGRVLAVGILGPIGEELIFRGILFARIAATRAGVPGAIIITSLVWTLLHIQYGAPVLLLIVVDGLLLALARVTTKSVWVPVAMHIVWNLYAIW